MVQILLMLKALFTLKDIFCEDSTGCESSLVITNYLFWFGIEPVQVDFHYDFFRMTDEADGSVVLSEL